MTIMHNAAELAKMVTSFLTPAIPYLLKGGEEVGQGMLKKMGSDVWDWTKTIWTKLLSSSKSKLTSKETISEIEKAATEVVDNPTDEDAQAGLRYQIKKLLTNDSELHLEISKIVGKIQKDSTQTATRIGGIDISGGSSVNNLGNMVGGNQTINNK